MAIGYQPQTQGLSSRLEGHDLAVGFGLLPNFEAVGQIASNSIHENCFAVNCGERHMIASGKLSVPLDYDRHWYVAAGGVDLFGSTNYIRSLYGVATYDNGPFQASAGVAKRWPGVNGSISPLARGFASVAWQPLPLIRGHLEFSGRTAYAGVRLFAPSSVMPEGWSLSAAANARLNNDASALTKKRWWDVALTIPLGKVSKMRTSAPEPARPAATSADWAQPAVAAPIAPATAVMPDSPAVAAARAPIPRAAEKPVISDPDLQQLGTALERRGFEDIFVGRMPDGTIAVRVNNGTFRRNTVDGLGAALGVVARSLGPRHASYSLIVTQRQVPLVASVGQADCVKRWVDGGEAYCMAGQLLTPGSLGFAGLQEGAAWTVSKANPSWRNLRVKIGPLIGTKLGTEFGMLDVDLGANVEAELPLWRGATVTYAIDVPLARTRNYEPGAVFEKFRILPDTERLAITQSAALPILGRTPVIAQVTAGRMGTFYDGVVGSARWEAASGSDRISVTGGALRNNSYDNGQGPLGALRTAYPVYASYRHTLIVGKTDFEAVAGQFMNNDRGFQVGFRQWYNDASVGVFYKRTRDYGGGPGSSNQYLAVELSVKFGPREDARPIRHLQIGGSDRFAHTVETTIRTGVGSNPLRPGRALQVPTPDANVLSNLDRTSLDYFEANLSRIRDAARE